MLRTLFLLACVGIAGLLLPPQAHAARPRPVRPDPEEARPSPPELDIRFDHDVVDQILAFAARGIASSDELERWVRLPGNLELLRQGRIDHDLTPDILKEAARVIVAGGTYAGPATLGTLTGSDWEDVRRTLAAIRAREDDMRLQTRVALAPYLPPDRVLPPVLVHFHLGGNWDGRTTDTVFINLTLFQTRGARGLPGLDALLVHEVFHAVHNALMPGPDDYSSRQAALYSVLMRVQQEGTARHLEYEYLRARAPADGMDGTNLAKYEDGRRRAGEYTATLAAILASIDANKIEKARLQTLEALQLGGPLYALGHVMAEAVEKAGGPAALGRTVVEGPMAFTRAYLAAIAGTGAAGVLPPGMEARLQDLERGYGRGPMAASQARRDGLKLLEQGQQREAARTLRESIDLDPTDATSAYNLACVWALRGKRGRALRWLETSFDRGFDNYKHAANDPDLESLRNDPEFRELLHSRGFDLPRATPQVPPEPSP